jgi:twitching motility protein PilJ
MADKSDGVGSVIRNPLIATMVILLIVMITGFSSNYYFINQEAQRKSSYIGYASELKVLSQEIAKHAARSSQGNIDSLPVLTRAKGEFDTNLGYLVNGNPIINLPPSDRDSQNRLRKITSLWVEMKANVDMILANRKVLTYLQNNYTDLSITMSAIQAENQKLVAALLRLSRPANHTALAQRQSLLIERMSHSMDKILQSGSSKSLSDNFSRDSQTFTRVLNGMTNGDKQLLLTAATNAGVRSSLTKIRELFRSVSSGVNEITSKSGDLAQIRTSADAIYAASNELPLEVDALIDTFKGVSGLGIVPMVLAPTVMELGFVGGSLFLFLFISLLINREGQKNFEASVQTNEENQAAVLLLLNELADLADGDLSVQATVTESYTGAIADSINFSFDQMRGLVKRINETSGKVSSVAETTQNSVGELAEASQRQSNEISDVSDAVDDMAVSIDMVSYNAAESSSVAERSVDIANKGAVVVQNTIDGMDKIRGQIQETAKRIKRLGESSQEIGDIVALINDIADQTNILSLNAAIQASMAGDAGKGFAVVADEVQRLAERSGAAAKQISALVKTIQSDTNEAVSSMEQTTAEVVHGTQLAEDAGVALGEIEGVSKSLAEIIENISDAARKQAASAGQISNTMKSIQEITSQTTDGVRATAKSVGGLAGMTNELRTSVAGFKIPE